jgi:glycosyltransferase involved in cell wall biosynthesis
MGNPKIAITGNSFPFGEGIAYGGERIIYYLIQELAKMDYDIYLFAREGCKIPSGIVKDYVPIGILQDKVDVHYEAVKKYEQEHNISFDLYFCGYFGNGWHPELINEYPYIELTWCAWCHIAWQLGLLPFNTVSYSKVLRGDFLERKIGTIMIHYGLPINLYKFEPEHDNYAVWIGKIEDGKAPKAAIELALASGMKIVLIGPPYDMRCFKSEVMPYLGHPDVIWMRGADDVQKQKIMSRAKVFISSNGNMWREHFGIVNIEALAMGVPIIAFNRINQDCAIKIDEIIEDGKHGYFLNYQDSYNVDEIIQKGVPLIQKIDKIDRMECRKQFEAKFTAELMAMRYSWLFKEAMEGKRYINKDVPF